MKAYEAGPQAVPSPATASTAPAHASGSGLPALLLTPAQVAERLAVSVQMAYKLIRMGELPAVYVGRLPRVEASGLANYIERRRTRGEAGK